MTAAAKSRFLDLQALTNVEHLRFATRQRIDGSYSGRHRSRKQGGAGEFVDYREYAAGEDLRRLDWKVLARTGRSFVRLFQDETNLLCTFVIDASGSMQFGSSRRGTKLEYAQYLATALAYVINRGQDQVGLAVATDRLETFLPPSGGRSHLEQVHERVESIETRPVTRMGAALRDLFERQSRRGVLLVLSDFLMEDLEATFAALRLFRHRQWEVITLHLIDPDEERLPEGTAYRFEGLEGEGDVNCSPDEIRALYEQRFEAHAASVRALALAEGCDYRRVSTAIGYLQTLGDFLVERSG
jgi:uncharacterized protein (DUF58 family)